MVTRMWEVNVQEQRLEQQLDAANQRIAALEAHLRDARSDSSFFEDRMAMPGALDRKRIEELTQRAEAAERKLATAIECLERLATDDSEGVRFDAKQALAQIEQPQSTPNQPFPGDDPPSDACQCSACLALRRKARV
jgi:septal ring factor EnvC (AmiA/AmiB activator)